jgi:hypothetical protein
MNNLAAASKEILVIRGQSRAVNDNLLCTVGAHICSGHSFDIETHGRISTPNMHSRSSLGPSPKPMGRAPPGGERCAAPPDVDCLRHISLRL